MTDTYEQEDVEKQPAIDQAEQQSAKQDWQISKIEAPLDLKRAGSMPIDHSTGGLTMKDYRDAMEFAKMMAGARLSIPPHLQGNAYDCLMVISRALWWRLDPVFVADHTYEVNRRIAYDASIWHAVIESRQVCQGRLRHSYAGEGLDRTCTVWGTPKGETETLSHTSPPLKQLLPPMVEKDGKKYRKGSPLWETKPDQQLYYNTVRDFGRKYFPDIFGGIYSRDEAEQIPPDPQSAKLVSPNLLERLPGRIEGKGFAEANVENGLKPKPAEPDQPASAASAKAAETSKTQSEGQDSPDKPKRASAAPKPAKGKSGRDWQTEPPKDQGEYKRYLKQWLPGEPSAIAVMSRFKREMNLRNSIGMVSEETDECRAMVKERVAEMGEGK